METIPLTPAQARFLALDMPHRTLWNESLLLDLRAPVSARVAAAALEHVVAHHAALRMRYRQTAEGEWLQSEAPAVGTLLCECLAADAVAVAAACAKATRSLNLEEGVLLRAVYLSGPNEQTRLFITIHHLAIDSASWRIVLADLELACRQIIGGKAVQLPPVDTPLRTWSERLARRAADGAFDDEYAFWNAQTSSADVMDDWPRDASLADGRRGHAGEVAVHIDAARTGALVEAAPTAYRTRLSDLLLSALARVLGRWLGRTHVLIELRGDAREALFGEIEDLDLGRTVGRLTSAFPVRLEAHAAIDATICAVKERLRAVPRSGVAYGALAMLGATADLGRGVPPRLTFSYLGEFDRNVGDDALLDARSSEVWRERDPDGPCTNWLNVRAQIADGSLRVVWTYSRECYREPTIAAVAADFREALHAVIAHCLDVSNGKLTASDVPLVKATQAQLDQLVAHVGSARKIEDAYPLTPVQQELWRLARDANTADGHVSQLRATLDAVDRRRFAAVWRSMVAHHALLRTVFWQPADVAEPWQVVLQAAQAPIEWYDWSGLPNAETRWAALCEAHRSQPFDLMRATPIRLAVVRLERRVYRLIVTRHHLLLDGRSTRRMLGEIASRYAGNAADKTPQVCYRDYVAWLARQDIHAARAFWQRRVRALEAPTLVGEALGRGRAPSRRRSVVDLRYDADETGRLERFALTECVAINTLVQGAWALVLRRCTGQRRVAFGSTVSGRPATLPGIHRTLGPFTNTLPIVQTLSPTMRVGEWLRALQADNVALRDFEWTSLHAIQAWTGPPAAAIFDTVIAFEGDPMEHERFERAAAALALAHIEYDEPAPYPMTLVVTNAHTLAIDFRFDPAVFHESEALSLRQLLARTLNTLADEAERPLAHLLMLETAPDAGRLLER